MIKKLKYIGLLGIIFLYQTSFGQKTIGGSAATLADPIVSNLHTLSIHVRDTVTHDSVFHFFIDKLKLPVYYYPVGGERKWAGIYAGNIVLEPCGPYTAFNYATSNFRAIFFGLTYEPAKSMLLSEKLLSNRGIAHPMSSYGHITLTDTLLCKNNIVISLMEKSDKVEDKIKRDSLQTAMSADIDNELGIQYVKEIWIGYTDELNLHKWEDFIKPSKIANNGLWKVNSLLETHFIKSNIKAVKGIVFKVRSLEKARGYLLKNKLLGRTLDKKIELDKSQVFGLSIGLTEEN